MSRGEARRHEMNVAGLQPNTTYQFQIVALTHHAASPPTEVKEIICMIIKQILNPVKTNASSDE